MPTWSVFALTAAFGVLVVVASVLVLRWTGADQRTARRLAGPRELKVGAVAAHSSVPHRPVRVAGRIRCPDPLHPAGSEPLVAYHRDVEVRLPRVGWRSLERVREARSFDLWDHGGSLALDPSLAAEPLVTIPAVWRGDPAQLAEPHLSAVRLLEERHGPAIEARATTRTVAVTDRLLVVARAVRGDDGSVRLRPPDGGYVISTLALEDAMRLLGGRHRRTMAASLIGIALGGVMAVVGGVGALIGLVIAG